MSSPFSTGLKTILLCLLATALFAGLLVTQYQLQQETQQIRHKRFQEKMYQLLPMMREAQNFETLATERLLRLTAEHPLFDHSAVQGMVHRLQDCFGSRLKLAVWNNQNQLTHYSGFMDADKSHLQNIMLFLQYSHTGKKPPLAQEVYDDSLRSLFSSTIRASHPLWNSVCIKRCELHKEPGLACFISRVSNSGLSPYFFQYLPPTYHLIEGTCTGQVMAFLPTGSSRREWVQEQLSSSSLSKQAKRCLIFDLPPWGSAPDLRTLSDSLPREGALPATFFAEVTQALQHSPQVVLLQGNQAVCGIRTFDKAPQAFVLLFDLPSETLSPVLMFLLISLISAWVLTLLVTCRCSGILPVWNLPLPAKFTRVMLTILLLPVSGMLAMLLSRSDLEADSRQVLLEMQLEERLLSLENRAELFVHQRLFDVYRDISRQSWALTPTASAVVDFFNRHHEQGLEELFILHRDSPQVLSQKVRTKSGQISIHRIVSLLFKQFQENTGLYVNRQQQTDASDDLQGRFLMEGMQDMFGGDSLYRIALYQNHLLPFSLFEDMTWISFRTLYDALHQPLVAFMVSLNRKDLQRQIVGQWVVENTPESPSVATLHFVHSTEVAGFHFMPEYAGRQPELRQILSQVARSGGTHRSVIDLDGREYFCVARRMRFIDFAVLGLEPIDPIHRSDSPQAFWLFSTLFPLLGLYLARSRFQRIYLEPILAIEQSVHELAKGNTDAPFPQQSGDEIAFLGQAFSRMATSLREKEFLQRFLSDFTLDLVRHPSQIRASRLQATILFADIRGFTTLSENCPANELVTMLNEYFTRMETVIEPQGGSIDKFIGDAIMAVFLPQIGREHPAIRAMKAGLHMQEEAERLSRERESRGQFSIRIGVGLGTGEVLLGLVGNESGRQDFAVTGPTVSLAAAMEKRSKEGVSSRVIVCSETSSHLPTSVSLRPLPPSLDLPAGFEIHLGS